MKYPREFKGAWNHMTWTPIAPKKQDSDEAIEAQVAEVIEEQYGCTAMNEYEVEEFCRLQKFREFMLKAFVPSTTKH